MAHGLISLFFSSFIHLTVGIVIGAAIVYFNHQQSNHRPYNNNNNNEDDDDGDDDYNEGYNDDEDDDDDDDDTIIRSSRRSRRTNIVPIQLDTNCCICYEPITNNFVENNVSSLDECDGRLAILPCDHLFHQKCLLKWLSFHHNCPLCRLELSSEQVDIYMNRA